jgi:hypothetical protein
MYSLESQFDELLAKLKEPGFLNPAQSDPVYYFVYPPEKILEVKKAIPRWSAKFGLAGFQVKRISLSEILWRTVDQSGWWEEWLELEKYADQEDINESVRDALRNDRFINTLKEEVLSAPEGSVILLTEAELLHPFFRTQLFENRLNSDFSVPIVIFYPGIRSGQYGLRFLGFYDVDGNYRSTLVGGA